MLPRQKREISELLNRKMKLDPAFGPAYGAFVGEAFFMHEPELREMFSPEVANDPTVSDFLLLAATHSYHLQSNHFAKATKLIPEGEVMSLGQLSELHEMATKSRKVISRKLANAAPGTQERDDLQEEYDAQTVFIEALDNLQGTLPNAMKLIGDLSAGLDVPAADLRLLSQMLTLGQTVQIDQSIKLRDLHDQTEEESLMHRNAALTIGDIYNHYDLLKGLDVSDAVRYERLLAFPPLQHLPEPIAEEIAQFMPHFMDLYAPNAAKERARINGLYAEHHGPLSELEDARARYWQNMQETFDRNLGSLMTQSVSLVQEMAGILNISLEKGEGRGGK